MAENIKPLDQEPGPKLKQLYVSSDAAEAALQARNDAEARQKSRGRVGRALGYMSVLRVRRRTNRAVGKHNRTLLKYKRPGYKE